MSKALVRVYRGPLTESIHRIHLAVVNSKGSLLHEAGDPFLRTFARSTAKLIQALPVLESGAAAHFGLSQAEIALCCASHNGEAQHADLAQSILAKIGLSHTHLQCGVHEPYHTPTAQEMRRRGIQPTSLHNNCSGKHSGMLTLAAYLQAPVDTYMDVNHPVQKFMLEAVSDLSDVSQEEMILGTDGCGVPVFGMTIDRLAVAFARLGQPDGLAAERASACRQIIDSVRKNPECLAGDDRFDTQLIRATQGRIVGKMGAEGVFALTIPIEGIGFAVKVEDGNQRALYPAVVEALHQLSLLSAAEVAALAEFHTPVQRNWQGTEVGRIEPDFSL
ncbi:asparaginase [Paenibacillus hexagrammi]|uniref:Asparaginase n=2 Tax=Paenibacillus hexagrammi TaxID=2908839 RepID=A0ABY3SQH1_9BACL|nr:asparaginase [Paenibacillus sp. YPD9-1]